MDSPELDLELDDGTPLSITAQAEEGGQLLLHIRQNPGRIHLLIRIMDLTSILRKEDLPTTDTCSLELLLFSTDD